MRDSVPCVAAFLFIVAYKIYFTDSETARLLYLMAERTRLTRDIPTSTNQIEDVVNAISVFGDQLLPTSVYKHVADTLDRHLLNHGSRVGESSLFKPSSLETIAEVFCRVFEALKDEDVVKVSLEGGLTAVWLFSVFLWLFPDETGCIVSGQRLYGNPTARISLCFSSCSWTVQEWRVEAQVSSIVIGNERDYHTHKHDPDPNYMPLGSARTAIECQCGLRPEQTEAIGPMAAALIDFTFEFGRLYSDDASAFVPLKALSQVEFISTHQNILKDFGWVINEQFREEQRTCTDILGRLVNEEAGIDANDLTDRIFLCLSSTFGPAETTRPIMDRSIIRRSIHIATEAIYYCFCSRFPSGRLFRWSSFFQNKISEERLWALLPLPTREGIKKANITLSKLRAEALKAMLPGATDVTENDLAVSFGGYVAFSSALEKPTCDPRHATSISVIPGILRYRKEPGRFEKLSERGIVNDFFPTASIVGHEAPDFTLCMFQGPRYRGIEAKADPEDIEVRTFLSAHRRNLELESKFQCGDWDKSCGARSEARRVSISWRYSIEAVAFAHHVNGHDLSPIAEEELAHALQQRGSLQDVSWQIAGNTVHGGAPSRFVTMTTSNDFL